MTNLPYSPVHALLSPTDDTLVYLLQPQSPTSPVPNLLILNTTSTLRSPTLSFTTITNPLPFFEDGTGVSYTPAIDSTGKILAYTGSCKNGASDSALWVFQPSSTEPNPGDGWSKFHISTIESAHTRLNGANHLAAGATFSHSNATAEMYVFGGMCPYSSTATAQDWTQMADYSNSMLALKSDVSTDLDAFGLAVSPSRGPPIPEAGFTMTPLLPSFTQSEGTNKERQTAQSYVLLGGHTQTAFINMSQVALFSLPEQSWTFLPVDPPSEEPKTDLTVRNDVKVEPRSGHTAVLTTDGKRVIIFGGWVGDVNTAARPQMAVLELGEGYGGAGDWQWSIPDQTGAGPASGTGMYGHGAVMLPGDVMMVTGGYMIPSSGTYKYKRAGVVQTTNTYFFNTTCNVWMSQYTHPKGQSKDSVSASPSSESITASKRAGLGAGLVFGILALLAIVVFYFWYARRLKRKRDAHEEDLRNLGPSGQRAHWSVLSNNNQPESEMIGRESRDAYPWQHAAPSREPAAIPQVQRTGLLFEIPSPTRGLRRSLHSRGAYQPAPRYDDGRTNRASSNIHPIDERDEYEDEAPDQYDRHALLSAPVLDPFQDPGSRSPSPQSPAQERELEIQRWVNDWAAADARMHQQAGRSSPDKTDRTSSTLSEQSMRSNWSGRSIGSFSRSLSQRSAALFSHAYPSTDSTTPPFSTYDLQNAARSNVSTNPTNRPSQSLTRFPRRATASDALGTASIQQLRQESEALLGAYSDAGPASPTRMGSRTRGWMGSMRRAFGTDRSASTSPEHGWSSASSSPTKLHHEGGVPRRAASAGGVLWQKRQGAKDWDAHEGRGRLGMGEGNTQNADEGEWDVESAVERRVVQVMFTVPREKLRVVNGAPEGDGESMLSKEINESEEAAEGTGKQGDEEERTGVAE
ncbi:MAG: hypothetical protein L6R37_002784 [Teloschistes peruensis]|nr:MAG: hypothetical protein L6R37_002784 [Teloschistes peruensis]